MAEFTIRMMYKTELAAAYGCSLRVLRGMIAQTATHLKKQNNNKDVLGNTRGRVMLSCRQIELIVTHNGKPE